MLVESNCPFAYKMSYRAVIKGSVGLNPCTNKPVPCQICLNHYLDHMQSIHPGQKLTEEEVAKYAIHKEEYLGVLGKEYTARSRRRG